MGLDVLQSPRGAFKIVQILFTIIAFSVVCSFHKEVILSVNCGVNDTSSGTQQLSNIENAEVHNLFGTTPQPDQIINYVIDIDYPFKLEKQVVNGTTCNGEANVLSLRDQTSSDAIFFVLMGVTSLIYCTIVLIFYVFCESLYQANFLPAIDLVIHFILVLFWFAASIALAVGAQQLADNTSIVTLTKSNPLLCAPMKCTIDSRLDVSGLVAADVFGFLSFFIFAGNMWFIYKETAHYKDKA